MVTRRDGDWEAWFTEEQARLLATFRRLVDGGVIEQIAPLGVAGRSGVPAGQQRQIGVSTWPFPPAADTEAALLSLGYALDGDAAAETTRRYTHAGSGATLLLAEAGSDAWGDALLVRDFAAVNEVARRRFAAQRDDVPDRRLLADAAAWWVDTTGYAPLHALAAELDGCPCQWAIGSGWAIDLFLGRVTRVHHDVDLIVDRRDQFALREHLAARGYRFVTPLDGRLEPWPTHMRIELPRHQVHAHRENDFIDILLTDFAGGFWHYRRDASVARSIERSFRQTDEGLRYLAPELVLLFKSKNTGLRDRPKDQQDFDAVVAHLDEEARAWLRWALVATDPGHAWLTAL